MALKIALQSAYSTLRRWWARGKIWISKSVAKDLQCIADLLLEDEYSPIWSQYIGLLVPCDATHSILSDASYAGIGGWTLNFGALMWRVTREDLLAFGFNMKSIGPATNEPTDPAQQGLHINPLEFLAAIINLWLALKCISLGLPCSTGTILDLLSDNTTALSWTHVAATTPNPDLQQLARFASALFVQAARLLTRVQPSHIPGLLNEEVDTLSLCSKSGQIPSWELVISQHCLLQTCRICLLPRKLLYTLAHTISSPQTAVIFDEVTTDLLTLDLNFLPIGSLAKDLTSSLQPA